MTAHTQTFVNVVADRPTFWRRLARWWCGIVGHEIVRAYERERIYGRCLLCGHETIGWSLARTTPQAESVWANKITRVNELPTPTHISEPTSR